MPESWIEATASVVTNKQLKRKSDGKPFTLYTVETDRGEFSTAIRAIAQKAHGLIDKPGRYLVQEEQRGEFVNYYLQDVEPSDRPAQSRTSSFPEEKPQQRGADLAPDMSGGNGVEPDAPVVWSNKDINIMRQTAGKVAGAISRTPEEFWENIGAITDYFIDGTIPDQFTNIPAAFADNDPDAEGIPF